MERVRIADFNIKRKHTLINESGGNVLSHGGDVLHVEIALSLIALLRKAVGTNGGDVWWELDRLVLAEALESAERVVVVESSDAVKSVGVCCLEGWRNVVVVFPICLK